MGFLFSRSPDRLPATPPRPPMSLDRCREAAMRLAEIDSLQDDVLRRLDELERQTAAILAQCLHAVPTSPGHAPIPASPDRRQAA